MPKFLRILLAFIFLIIFIPSYILASGFQLTHIGNMSVEGFLLDEWWYTGSSITLTGKAMSAATISITTDGNSSSTTADNTGAWSHNLNLSSGDHEIVLSSNGSTIAFTLHAGQELPANVGAIGGDGPSQPVAGVSIPTIGLLSFGLLLVIGGIHLAKRRMC